MPSLSDKDGSADAGLMELSGMCWDPLEMFDFVAEGIAENSTVVENPQLLPDASSLQPWSLGGDERNQMLHGSFTSAVGGLQPQIKSIIRRVLDGRVVQSVEWGPVGRIDGDESGLDIKIMEAEAEAAELASLGLKPVRGLLLYGPPGCGEYGHFASKISCNGERLSLGKIAISWYSTPQRSIVLKLQITFAIVSH